MKALILFLYRLLQWISFPAVALYLSVRAFRQGGYGLGERLGGAPESSGGATRPGGVWLHAVSVGEVLSAVRLVGELKAARPLRPVHVSVGTRGGREMAEARLKGLADSIFYVPLDYAWCVRRVLRRVRPALLLILETEIWPNLWNEAAASGVGVLVVNGRLSDRAWPRYERLRWFFGPVLRLADRILAQDETSRERYVALGADAAKVVFAGNLKYDLGDTWRDMPYEVSDFIVRTRPERIWIAASTMPPADAGDPDEDDEVIGAFESVAANVKDLLLVLVPRKTERFDEAARKLAARGVRFARRSELSEGTKLQLPGVLLLDSMGELASLFPIANVVFMGGTLASRGGHNILEPAFAAKPVIVGPHMENFAEIAQEFRKARALVEIGSGRELAGAVTRILREGDGGVGERARRVAEAGQGATARAVEAAVEVMDGAMPRRVASLPARAAAGVWGLGAAVHRAVYERGLLRPKRLLKPVVSVGGIAVGGTGKTPLAIWLARELAGRGMRVAFLTRGYGRRGSSVLALKPGERREVEETGDEAQILIASGAGAVGIGADRYAAGMELVRRDPEIDLFVLDDGFQHHRLRREFDLVAIDALDPFAGGRLLPAGRLREPMERLSHASAFLVTRAAAGESYPGLRAELARWNADAPVFLARNVIRGWRALDGAEREPPAGPVMAFCGLGNPVSFWNSLQELGVEVRRRWTYADHHRYDAGEVAEMVQAAQGAGVKVLVTSQKDAANLPRGAAGEGVEIYWLALDVEIERGDELLRLIFGTIGAGGKR